MKIVPKVAPTILWKISSGIYVEIPTMICFGYLFSLPSEIIYGVFLEIPVEFVQIFYQGFSEVLQEFPQNYQRIILETYEEISKKSLEGCLKKSLEKKKTPGDSFRNS